MVKDEHCHLAREACDEEGTKKHLFFPPAAFLLTILSFTSVKPASVFVLYVATVSRALPLVVHWDFCPCWWCKWRGCGVPMGQQSQELPQGAGRGAAVMPPRDKASSMGAATPWCHRDGHKAKVPAHWWLPKAQLSFLGTSATQGSSVAMGLPLFCWAMSGSSAPAGCFGSCGHTKKATSSHHIALRAAEPRSPLSCPPLQALTTSLQGFLHSLAYGWLRRNFRREAVGPRPSLQHPRGLQGFYDESLGGLP